MKIKLLSLVLVSFLISNLAVAQRDTIAAWTFVASADSVAVLSNIGLDSNSKRYISAEDTTTWPETVLRDVTLSNGVTDNAGSATGWDNGANAKLWSVKFKAEGYTNLQVSSKQRSGGNKPGPRDWKLQAIIKGGDWIDVENGNVTVANDWTTGVVENLPLPADLNNPGSKSMFVRWIMVSDTSSTGELVTAEGVSKIDDVVITGEKVATVADEKVLTNDLQVYPNPAKDFVTIQSNKEVSSVEIFNSNGKLINRIQLNSIQSTIDVSELTQGVYFIRTNLVEGSGGNVKRLLIK